MITEIDRAIVRSIMKDFKVEVGIFKNINNNQLGAMITSITNSDGETCFCFDGRNWVKVRDIQIENVNKIKEMIVEGICKQNENSNS